MPEELEKFAWPGGYTILYRFTVDSESIILCWECATKATKGIKEENSDYEYYKQTGSFIHWEGESLWCDDCGTELESEYGNPDEEKEPQVDAGELACEKTPTIDILPDDEWRKSESPPYELNEDGYPIKHAPDEDETIDPYLYRLHQ